MIKQTNHNAGPPANSQYSNCTIAYLNKPIKNNIPFGVKKLTFGKHFNYKIKHNIPKSVTHLTLGDQFNQKITDESIPSVVFLICGNRDVLESISFSGHKHMY